MNVCVHLITDEMSQFGLLELSESQGVFEEDEQNEAPANQTDSQKPASQCLFKLYCKLLTCCPLVFKFFNGFLFIFSVRWIEEFRKDTIQSRWKYYRARIFFFFKSNSVDRAAHLIENSRLFLQLPCNSKPQALN